MAGGSRRFAAPIERLRKIKLRIRLIRIYFLRFLPGIYGLFGMSQARGEQAVVRERIRIAWKALQHFLIVRVGVGIAAVRDQGAGGGLLQRDAAGIDGDGASERGDSLIALALPRFRACDALLDEAIVRIDSGGAQQSGKISFVRAQREMELIEAAPEEQQRRDGEAERRSRQKAHDESAGLARRSHRWVRCGS